LLVAVTLPVTSASCREKFLKNEINKNISQKFLTSERLGNIDLLSVERYELKIDLDDFVDESESRRDNKRIKLLWSDDDIKFKCRLCRDLFENCIVQCLLVWIFLGLEVTACFAYDKTIINQSRVEKQWRIYGKWRQWQTLNMRPFQ